jgi:hypothetical protein
LKDNDTPLIFVTEQPTGFDHAWLYDEDDRMDDPVTLDTRRCVRARKDTEARRRRRTVAEDMEAVRARQAMLERYLHGEAPRSWHELAEKARAI